MCITDRAPNQLKATTMNSFIKIFKLQEPILWSVVTLEPYVTSSGGSLGERRQRRRGRRLQDVGDDEDEKKKENDNDEEEEDNDDA